MVVARKIISKITELNRKAKVGIKIQLALVASLVVFGTVPAIPTYAVAGTPLAYLRTTRTPNSFSSATQVATIAPDGTVTRNFAGPSTNPYFGSPRYSPDHKLIAWASQPNPGTTGSIILSDPPTRTNRVISLPVNESVSQTPVWYPNSSKLAFVTWNSLSQQSRLRTVNADGSNLQTVPYVDANSITSLAVSGDGTYLVYANSSGLRAIQPGSPNSVLMQLASTNCGNLKTRPGTSRDVAFICNASTYTAIYWQTIGSTTHGVEESVYNYAVNAQNKSYQGISWSPDGSRLALSYTLITNNGNCTFTSQQRIATVSANISGLTDLIALPSSYGFGCKGGGGPEVNVIAWSPEGGSIAYLPNDLMGNGSPIQLTSSTRTSSTAFNTAITLVSSNVTDISW